MSLFITFTKKIILWTWCLLCWVVAPLSSGVFLIFSSSSRESPGLVNGKVQKRNTQIFHSSYVGQERSKESALKLQKLGVVMGITNGEEMFSLFLIQKYQCLLSSRNRLNRTIHTILMDSDSFLASGLLSPLLSHSLHCMRGWQLGLDSCLSFLWSVVCVLPKMQKSWGKKMTIQLLWMDTGNCGYESYFSGHVPDA